VINFLTEALTNQVLQEALQEDKEELNESKKLEDKIKNIKT